MRCSIDFCNTQLSTKSSATMLLANRHECISYLDYYFLLFSKCISFYQPYYFHVVSLLESNKIDRWTDLSCSLIKYYVSIIYLISGNGIIRAQYYDAKSLSDSSLQPVGCRLHQLGPLSLFSVTVQGKLRRQLGVALTLGYQAPHRQQG